MKCLCFLCLMPQKTKIKAKTKTNGILQPGNILRIPLWKWPTESTKMIVTSKSTLFLKFMINVKFDLSITLLVVKTKTFISFCVFNSWAALKIPSFYTK